MIDILSIICVSFGLWHAVKTGSMGYIAVQACCLVTVIASIMMRVRQLAILKQHCNLCQEMERQNRIRELNPHKWSDHGQGS